MVAWQEHVSWILLFLISLPQPAHSRANVISSSALDLDPCLCFAPLTPPDDASSSFASVRLHLNDSAAMQEHKIIGGKIRNYFLRIQKLQTSNSWVSDVSGVLVRHVVHQGVNLKVKKLWHSCPFPEQFLLILLLLVLLFTSLGRYLMMVRVVMSRATLVPGFSFVFSSCRLN